MQQADTSTAMKRLLDSGMPVLALASSADKIVPRALTEQCFQPNVQPDFEPVTPPNHHITLGYHVGRSHCLPLSAPLWCAEVMVAWLSQLIVATGYRNQGHNKCI